MKAIYLYLFKEVLNPAFGGMKFLERKNQRGQIAVVITLIIAAVLLLTMIFINIHKVSTIKTLTSQTADKTALRIASKIGSLSRVYFQALSSIGWPVTIDNVNKTAYVYFCGLNLEWWSLPLLAVVALATIVAFLVFLNPVILLTGIGLFVSMSMTSGITQKFQDMSAYNAIREDALFQAMLGLQSDYVELKNLGGVNQGKFQDPAGGPIYNLSMIPGMKTAAKVPRFLAWYYTTRFPLVDESVLKGAMDKFINGKMATSRDGFKKYVYIDPADWDSTEWKIKKLAFTLAGQRSPYVGDFTVTCSSCPDWVLDSTTDTIKLVSIDENDAIDNGSAWFIKDKLRGLLGRLENDYCSILAPFDCISIYCTPSILAPLCNNPLVNKTDLDAVEEDMRLILVRIKEVLNLPNAERLRGLTQWFTPFYDPSAHNADRTSKYNAGTYDENNSYDIYLRLNRDIKYIQTWIDGLTTFNTNTIIPPIVPNYDASHCKQGRGDVTDGCYTGIDYCCETCCDDSNCWCCGSECDVWRDALWAGNYGTCYKLNSHNDNPVCQNGDLYGAIPGWCSDYRPDPGCITHTFTTDDCCTCGGCDQSCSPPAEKFSSTLPTEYYYQGQFSWRPYVVGQYDWNAGPTEVEQAIEILQEWHDDLARLQMVIAALQRKIEDLQTTDILALRNEIIYAWKDKSGSVTDIPQYSHLASVKITNYPVYLPYISEAVSFSISWLGACKTRTLHNYKGEFEITASRYDQDQPNLIWNLRRRKQPLNPEYDAGILKFIVEDIQTTGKVALPREISLQAILSNYAIISKSKVQYGPEREDIAIISVDGGPSGP